MRLPVSIVAVLGIALLALAAPAPEPAVVASGAFMMGGEKVPDEGPLHRVEVAAFVMDVHEVTNGEFEKFLKAGGYGEKALWSEGGWKWRQAENVAPPRDRPRDWDALKKSLAEEFPNHPVVGVSFWEAEAYAKFAGKRLPTEVEWEKAARGTEGRIFPWGNDENAGGPVGGEKGSTRPVGTSPKDRSPYGILDLGGNVAEWTSSWYQAYPGSKHEERHYGEKLRVIRGGSWRFETSAKRRCAWRGYFRYGRPGDRSPFVGIRLVGDSKPVEGD